MVTRSVQTAIAERYLNEAINVLRQTNNRPLISLGLIFEAAMYRVTMNFDCACRDLDEALTLATRAGMRLHETDAHLEYARLHQATGDADRARESLAKAKTIIEDTGYHRRDGEVADLERALE